MIASDESTTLGEEAVTDKGDCLFGHICALIAIVLSLPLAIVYGRRYQQNPSHDVLSVLMVAVLILVLGVLYIAITLCSYCRRRRRLARLCVQVHSVKEPVVV